jgi:hypothetical protein
VVKNLLTITADYNDGDYVTSTHYDCSDDVVDLCKKVAEAIKNNKSWNNWENPVSKYKDILTLGDIENFNGYVPYAPDADEIHTIENITVISYVDTERIL